MPRLLLVPGTWPSSVVSQRARIGCTGQSKVRRARAGQCRRDALLMVLGVQCCCSSSSGFPLHFQERHAPRCLRKGEPLRERSAMAAARLALSGGCLTKASAVPLIRWAMHAAADLPASEGACCVRETAMARLKRAFLAGCRSRGPTPACRTTQAPRQDVEAGKCGKG